MKRWIIGLAICVAIAGIASCGGGGDGGTDTGTAIPGKATCTPEAGSGVVCGTVVASDGVTPLANAEVRLTSASASLSTKGVEDSTKCIADTVGAFACIVPADVTGTTSFVIVFAGFDNKAFEANIVTGATTDTGTQTMTGSATQKWVVVPGAFDGVQVLLAQLKGCTLNDMWGSPFDPATMAAEDARASEDCTSKGLLVLDDSDAGSATYVTTFLTSGSLAEYNSLFINCDTDESGYPGVDAAVQALSTGGGHVYFSDRSDTWLSSAFPGYITFAGRSTSTGTLSATVADANLAAVVGSPIDILFDLGAWTAVDSVVAGVTTYIEGDISGLSSYTGTHPITVGWRASSSSGCVFYTSYHIEGASTGSAQELAIKYLVQNIGTVCK